MKKDVYFMAAAIVMIFCASGVAAASWFTSDQILAVLGFTVEICGAGSGADSNSAWGTARGGSHIVKSPALGRTALPAPSAPRLRSSALRPASHVRWRPMHSKASIRGNRMFLLNPGGKKQLAPTGTYKLNNGKRVAVRNGLILPKANCK